MHKKQINRLLATVLSIVMILSLVVIPASAEDKAGAVGDSWVFTDFTAEMATAGKFDGLTLNNVTAHNSQYGNLGSGGTIAIPVAGKCNVEVSCQHGADGTVGVVGSDDAVPLKGAASIEETAIYSYASEDAGTVTITRGSGNVYVTKIEIKEYELVASLELDKDSVTLKMGETTSATVTATLTNSTDAITAISGKEDVATAEVGDDGKTITITAVAAGTATVTVAAGTLEKTVSVRVDPAGELSVTAGAYPFASKAPAGESGKKLTSEGDVPAGMALSGFSYGNDHGPNGGADSTLTLNLPADKYSTLVLTTCHHGNGGTIKVNDVELTGGETSSEPDGTNGKVYTIPNATGETVIKFGSSIYIHGITVGEFTDEPATDPTLSLDKEEVVVKVGGQATIIPTIENVDNPVVKCLSADGNIVTSEISMNNTITITGGAVGMTTLNVTVEGTDLAKTVTVYVGPDAIRELQDGDTLTFAADNGKVDLHTSEFATVVARAWHGNQYGLDFTTDNTVTMKVPADKKANITLKGSDADGSSYTASNDAGASFDVVKEGYDYKITGATGTVTITANGQMYLKGVEVALVDLSAASLVVAPLSVTMREGESKEVTATATGYDATMSLFAISADTTKATVAVEGDKITVNGVAEGETNVYVGMAATAPADAAAAAAVEGVKTVAVTVNPALAEGTKEWNFKEDFEGAMDDGLTQIVTGGKAGINKHSYGVQMGSGTAEDGSVHTAALGIPVDGPSKISVYVGYTWNVSMGDAQDPQRFGHIMQAGQNTPDAYKELEFIYTGDAGTVLLTAGIKEPTTYIEWIKVEPIALDVKKVEVWDFGPDVLNPAIFDNKLTVADMNAWFPSTVTEGSDNVALPGTFSTGDFSASSENTNNRLRTTNTAITRYDANVGRSSYATNANDPYDTVTTKTNGHIASNGGDIEIALANTKAGDKVTYVLNENSSGALDYLVTDGAGKETTLEKPAGEAAALSAYASADGAIKIHRAGTVKPVYVRIYRESPAATTVSGSFTADGIPDGYKLVLTNDDSGIAYEATVSGGSYTAQVARYRSGTSYTLSVENAEGWIVAVGDSLDVAYTDTALTNDVTAVSVDLVTVSGTVTGVETADLAKLVIEVAKPEGKIYQPKIVLDGASFSAKFEQGQSYELSALNANDYTLNTTSVSYSADASDATIAFTAKPVQDVTIVPSGLTLTDLAEAKFTFTNITETYVGTDGKEAPYAYTFTGTDNIKLRAGQYKVKVDNAPALQKLTPDLKVAEAAVNCPIPFNVEAITKWDFADTAWTSQSGAVESYNGLTMSSVQVNKTYALVGAGGTIQIPVTKAGDVVAMTYCYSGTGTLGDMDYAADSCSGSTGKFETVTYVVKDADVTAGYVTLTGAATAGATDAKGPSTYVTMIEITETVPYKDTVTVGATGKDSATIQGALDMVAKMDRPNNERVTIVVDPGNYEEQIHVVAPNVTLKNAKAAEAKLELKNKGVDIGENEVRITWYYGHGYDYYSMTTGGVYDPEVMAVNKANGYASFANTGGNLANTTFWNSTVSIRADGFEAEGIIFENSFNQYMSAAAKEDVIVSRGAGPAMSRDDLSVGDTTVQQRAWVERAAAVGIGNNVGKTYFENCAFVGRQDVVFGGTGDKVAFYDCDIYGSTDYIMGPMNALIAKCDLVLNVDSAASVDVAHITAGQQQSDSERGYLMWNCTITSTEPGVNTASALRAQPCDFGRPWGAKCEVIWYETIVESTTTKSDGTTGPETSIILPKGWEASGLGGKFDRSGEYNTHEAVGGLNANAEQRSGGATVLEYRKLLDGTKIEYETWLGDWTPFDDKGKDMTVVCDGGHPERAESIAVKDAENATATELVPGDDATEIQLTATVEPSTFTDVAWTSSSETVTVDATGKVTVPSDAAAEEVTITADAGKDEYGDAVSATYTVTVKSKTPATKVTVTGPEGATSSEAVAGVATTIQLSAAVEPAETTQKVTWTSSSEKVTVDATGLVTVPADAAAETVTITATAAVKAEDGTEVKTTYTVVIKSADNALADAIKAAEDEAKATETSEDGTDVSTSSMWVTEDVKDTFQAAIDAAKAVAADENATAADKAAAVDALKAAMATFVAAQQEGTRASIGRPAYGQGTTPDGEKSTTTTATNPDGSVVTTVKDKDGNLDITVKSEDGEELAHIKLPATVSGDTKFIDVPDDHWAAKCINDMAALGMVKGVNEDGTIFDMNSPITRGSIATILYRLSNGAAGKTSGFADVAADAWYADAIGWAANAKLITGYDETTFGPDDTITRQQLAVMIARMARMMGIDTSANAVALEAFTDGADTAAWATDGMAWCVKAGIVKGRGGELLDPTAAVTRAEAATMIDRMIGLVK